MPQFACTKKPLVTKAQIEQLEGLSKAFNANSRRIFNGIIASPALSTIEAEAILSFLVAAKQQGFSGRYTPHYLVDITEKYLDPAAKPVEKQAIENWPARWQAIQVETKALLAKTTLGTCPIAVLLKLGYRNADVGRAFQMSTADVTRVNTMAGLGKDAIRQQNAENEARISKLPPLSKADLPKNWRLEPSALTNESATDAFLSLNGVTQRAFITYCELKQSLQGTHVTEKALSQRFFERYEIPLRGTSLSRHVTAAQTALGYTEPDEMRYGPNRAKGMRTTEKAKTFENENKTLPANWKRNPTSDESIAAAEKFALASPLARLVFTLKCDHPDWSNKQLAAHINANYPVTLRSNNVADAMVTAKKALGLKSVSAARRKETQLKAAEVKALIQADLPQTWPAPYGFEDIPTAQAVWKRPGQLSDFYRIIFQTQASLAEQLGKLPTRSALAKAVSDVLKKSIKPGLLQKPLYLIRQQLKFTGFEKPDPNGIMAFNNTHATLSRDCPHDIWVLTANGNNKNPKGIEERFKLLQPLERLAVSSLVEVTRSAGEEIAPADVLSQMRGQCNDVPEKLTRQIVSHTLAAARKKLKLPTVRTLRKQIGAKLARSKR